MSEYDFAPLTTAGGTLLSWPERHPFKLFACAATYRKQKSQRQWDGLSDSGCPRSRQDGFTIQNKCSELAKAGSEEVGGQKWNVIDIDRFALYSSASLMEQAGKIYKSGETTESSFEVKPNILSIMLGGYARKKTRRRPAEKPGGIGQEEAASATFG